VWKQVKLPQVGEASAYAVVASVLVAPGDTVRRGDPVLEVASAPDAEPVPAPFDGVVREILVAAGQEVHVGDAVLTLDPDAADERGPRPPRSKEVPESPGRGDQGRANRRVTARRQPHVSVFQPVVGTSPRAHQVRRLARELGIDVADVVGTGVGGEVTEHDLKRHVREALRRVRGGGLDSVGPGVSPPRGEVPAAERVASIEKAWQTIPQATLHRRVEARDVMALIRQRARIDRLRSRHVVDAVLIKTAALAVMHVSALDGGEDPQARDTVSVGWAVEARGAVHVPVVEAADRRSVADLARELAEVELQIGAGWSDLPQRSARIAVSDLDEHGPVPFVVEPLRAILAFGEVSEAAPFAADPRRDLELRLAWDLRHMTTAVARDVLAYVARTISNPLQLAWH